MWYVVTGKHRHTLQWAMGRPQSSGRYPHDIGESVEERGGGPGYMIREALLLDTQASFCHSRFSHLVENN